MIFSFIFIPLKCLKNILSEKARLPFPVLTLLSERSTLANYAPSGRGWHCFYEYTLLQNPLLVSPLKTMVEKHEDVVMITCFVCYEMAIPPAAVSVKIIYPTANPSYL